ncbi:hypothetical protein [Schinkia azotoformans]|uniref:hypothetical protein n=1 Tax=Schinkia azotoformans TaxID=1454 RepID=UPI002DBCA2C4|nr:hypothetical protein [Schinkia azotoformans]MEC1782111.1 hypothetical protein [Schinkia azotoformans]MED4329571.1 hypothetical protein [Schinkia azotoformans]
MSWMERVKKNVFPVSNEKYNIRKALEEWIYEGNMFDVEVAEETCELCDQPNIRYQFEIVNSQNDNSLLIGSECITRFKISVIDEAGNKLSYEDAKKKVGKDRSRLVTEAKEKSVLNALVKLASTDNEFDIENFIKYFKERKAFTPKQLALLVWRLEKAKIDFNMSHFKLTIKRNREKEQLLELEDWKLRCIWDCLSTSQRQFVLREKNK